MRLLSEVHDGLVRVALAYTNAPGTIFEQGNTKFNITDQDLEDMQSNLAEHEVVIDYDHLSAAAHALPPGWAKAAGWLAKPDTIEPFTEGRNLFWGWARFTATMLAMIKDQEYRYCSIDFRWKDKNEVGESVGTYLHAVAMTNRPFLKDLPPIEISNEDYQQLMGMTVRQDGKLAAVTLSESGARLMNSECVRVPVAVKTVPASGGLRKEKTMANDSNASARLSSLVKETAKDMGIPEEQALSSVLATEEGKALWEEKRLAEIRSSKVLGVEGNDATIMLLHSLVREMTKGEKITGEQAFNRVMATKEGAALFARSRLEQLEASKWHPDGRIAATGLRLHSLLREMSQDQKITADEASSRVFAAKQGKAL